MTVFHATETLGGASGVATFVREIDAELKARGVDSRVFLVGEPFDSMYRPDVVHIHGLWLRAYHRAAQWAFSRGIPVVWSTHGMTAPWCMRHKRWKKLPAWWLYQRRDLARAAAIHCTTEEEAEWNRALGFDNCFIAPLGTREADVSAAPRLSSRRQSAPASPRTLLFVGRIYPVKGLVNLIRAWSIVINPQNPLGTVPPSSGTDPSTPLGTDPESAGTDPSKPPAFLRGQTPFWRLRIVGPDEAGHLACLKSEVKRLNVEDFVEFPGPKFGDDLSREYEECDCLVLPSFTENFGATVIDALAHAKPVIASTATPWRELRDRDCGWWVDNTPGSLASAIRAMILLGDRPRRDMGLRGRALVAEKYTWPAVAAALVRRYNSLASARPAGATPGTDSGESGLRRRAAQKFPLANI